MPYNYAPLPDSPWRRKLALLVEGNRAQRFIMAVIILNAITLGLETSGQVMASFGTYLLIVDKIALGIFVVELTLKLVARGTNFFRSAWNIFDFIIVAIALMPSSGPLSVLRALRVLRVLRLVSMIPKMRLVVGSMLAAMPGLASVVGILGLIFYVFAVMATKLFAASFPEWFGSLGHSFYTLFQVMTLESWSMGIVRPVMEVYPQAWLFFVVFILMTTFMVVNLVIAVVIDGMQAAQATEIEEIHQVADTEKEILDEVRALRAEVAALRAQVDDRSR